MKQSRLFHQPITLSELESHLWEAANILRGSPVDRTDWKSYILPLLFFKRICDVWEQEYTEAVETYGEDFDDEHRFQVPKDCHWNIVRETPATWPTTPAPSPAPTHKPATSPVPPPTVMSSCCCPLLAER